MIDREAAAARARAAMKCALTLLAIAAPASHAWAQAVPVCDGLTLYANAAASRLCKSVGPTTQNLWVCELAQGPDIHLTFNASTALHITVRTQKCEGYATLTGTFHGAAPLALAAGQPGMVCGVNVAGYMPRLNAVPRLTPQPYVTTAMNAAQASRRVTPAVATTYIQTATQRGCP